MKPEDQEYRDAFNADEQPMPADGEMPPEAPAAGPDAEQVAAEEAPPVDPAEVSELMQDETANVVPGDEGEAAGEEPAAAMSDAEPDPAAADGEEAAMTPEEIQQEKSWEGRLKKREEELAAREAALREKEMAMQGDSMEEEGSPVEEAMEEAAEGEESGEGGEQEAVEDVAAMLEDIKQEAAALAQDPERLASTIKQMVDDFGRDFVVSAAALAAPVVDLRASPLVESINGRMASMIDDITQALQSMHRAAIADAHEDFEEIAQSPEFKAYIEGLPDTEKERAIMVVDRGSSGQIIKLLTNFKDSMKGGKEKTPEDVWAEDAAAGVRGSATLKLPTKAPISPDDEYRRAWEEA